MSEMRGIVAETEYPGLARECARRGLNLVVGSKETLRHLPFAYNLYLGKDIAVPWELLEAAWALLQKWDVISPLYSYELLARDIGSPAERKVTAQVCGDLRQPAYSAAMVFIRNNPAGEVFYNTWREASGEGELALSGEAQMAVSGDVQLTLLRAIHRAKPTILQAPYSWLGTARTVEGNVNPRATLPGVKPVGRPRGPNLVKVQIGKNSFVMCRPGEEEATKRHYEEMARSKRGAK